jgi:hypothetical protein
MVEALSGAAKGDGRLNNTIYQFRFAAKELIDGSSDDIYPDIINLSDRGNSSWCRSTYLNLPLTRR